MANAKLQLLIELKNKLGAGLNSAKKHVSKATGDMQNRMNAFKRKSIEAFDSIKSQVPFLGKAISLLKNPFVAITAAAVGAVAAFRRVVAAGREWMRLARSQTEVEIQLATVMRNTMNATDAQIDSIRQLATEQQRLGVISDTVQLAGAQELATSLTKKESLKKLIPVMNDLLAQQYGYNASQQHAAKIAMMFGRVLNGEARALRRYGYQLTEAQEKIMQYGTEAQRVATLVDVITASVGGVNTALANTPQGMFRQLENEISNVRAEKGELFAYLQVAWLPVRKAALGFWRRMHSFVEQHKIQIKNAVTFVANIFSAAINVTINILRGLKNAFKFIYEWRYVIYGIVGAIVLLNAKLIAQTAIWLGLKAAMKVATAAQWLFNIAASANPIGLIVIAIGALIGGLIVAYKRFDRFRAIIKGTWEVVKGFGGILKTFVIDRIRSIISGLGRVGSALGKLFRGDFSGAFSEARQGVRELSGVDVKRNALESTKNLRNVFSETYNEVLADAKKRNEANEQAGDFDGVPSDDNNPTNNVLVSMPTDLDDARAIKGGSQTRNITINVGALAKIDQYSPTSTEINSMTPEQFERWFNEMGMRLLRSIEMGM